MTVNGPIEASSLGISLVHEHVLVDFIGADSIGYYRWDREEAARIILPYITDARDAGMNSFFECTPAFLGRDPRLLQLLSERTGVQFITNTGLYGASDNKYLPLYAFDAAADELSARWIREFERGIDGSGVRPGFIKIGVNPGPLSPSHRNLIRAAGRTHLATGLTIYSHTGMATPAFQQLDILKEEGVPAHAFVWVHAQNEKDLSNQVRAAKMGAWISFDGLSEDNQDEYLAILRRMKEEKLLNRVLLSHDAGWYTPGEPYGGDFRGYTVLLTSFKDKLLENGFSEDDYLQLAVRNPAEALAIDRVYGPTRNAGVY